MQINLEKAYFDVVLSHYIKNWGANANVCFWEAGPVSTLPPSFKVIEFAPTHSRKMWTYATCGMSTHLKGNHLELHLFSSMKDRGLVELLTAVAYYHVNTLPLDLNHTVNFGRPWQGFSKCEYGLISLPYLDGPELENLPSETLNKTIKCYWLIPITFEEVNYKKEFGVGALEEQFESNNFDYLNSDRQSVI